jgi:hypothetical protein
MKSTPFIFALATLAIVGISRSAHAEGPLLVNHLGPPKNTPEVVPDYYFNNALIYESDTTTYPNSTRVRLIVLWPNGGTGGCSGTLVRSNVVSTAAHCVYNAANGGYVQRVFVIPGADYKLAPFGLAEGIVYQADPCYVQSGSVWCDRGLIAIDRPLGNVTGVASPAVATKPAWGTWNFDRGGYGVGNPARASRIREHICTRSTEFPSTRMTPHSAPT